MVKHIYEGFVRKGFPSYFQVFFRTKVHQMGQKYARSLQGFLGWIKPGHAFGNFQKLWRISHDIDLTLVIGS